MSKGRKGFVKKRKIEGWRKLMPKEDQKKLLSKRGLRKKGE